MGYDTEAEMRQELLLCPLDGKAPGRAQRQLLMDRTAVKSAFAFTFDESNKAYAPYPALITTRKGRKDID